MGAALHGIGVTLVPVTRSSDTSSAAVAEV